jgi:iron complex transport system substrate-binding protein
MTMARPIAVALALSCAIALAACHANNTPTEGESAHEFVRTVSSNPAGCVDHFDPATDYFPDKATFESAAQVDVTYHGNYKVVTVTFRGFTDNPDFRSVERYALVQCGTPVPPLLGALEGAEVISIPAKTVTVTNNEDLGMMIALGLRDQIRSVGSRAIYDDELWKKFKEGRLPVTFGWGTSEIHVEWMLDLKPDVIVIGAFQSQATLNMQRAKDVGLQTIPSLTRVESTPLGRAEWIKALGAVFNLEATANRTYLDVAAAYRQLATGARAAGGKPRAFWATTYASGVWLAARNSFQARLLEDAGAVNALADTGPTVTVSVGPEVVVDRASDADYWITENSDLIHRDGSISVPGTPVGALRAATLDQVFHLARRYRHENNSADYYQTAPHRPDLMLADLVSVFHHELVPEHVPVFLAPMPPQAARRSAISSTAHR